MKKYFNKIIIILILFIVSCGRTNIEDIHNCVILQQHCGWDNLDGGFYQIKDLTTGEVKRIDVDIRDCDVYNVGDTVLK